MSLFTDIKQIPITWHTKNYSALGAFLWIERFCIQCLIISSLANAIAECAQVSKKLQFYFFEESVYVSVQKQ